MNDMYRAITSLLKKLLGMNNAIVFLEFDKFDGSLVEKKEIIVYYKGYFVQATCNRHQDEVLTL